MRFTPSNPLDSYHSQIEIENFKEEQQQKKEFMESVKQITKNAEKLSESSKIQSDIAISTSKKADIKGWIAVIISVLTFIMEICDRIGLF
ncbi:MAG TPA: hypothetical protein IAA12_11480 [Candidatus Blautia intestinipullorum]|nr:hypothetical protein [Candidatus Blautia intestinipullorum]